MTITALRIGHFGKLHNVTIEPAEGLNLVMGDNESGKSTVFAFIGAMLFGLDKGRGRAGRDDQYRKYLPWDTPGAFQGSMDFIHDGRKYRITRVFYHKEKSCVITDLDTGRKLDAPDESISAIIPELTRQAWNNTVSMGQKTLRYSDGFGDEMRNHIANLAMTGSGQVDVAGALSELEDRRKQIIKSSKDRLTAAQMEERVSEAEEQEREAAKLESGIRSLKEHVNELERQIADIEQNMPDVDKCARECKRCADNVSTALAGMEKARAGRTNEEPQDDRKNSASVRNTGIIVLAAGLLVSMIFNNKSTIGVGIGVAAMIVGLVCIMMAIIRGRENKPVQVPSNESDEDAEKEYRLAHQKFEEASDRLSAAKEEQDRILKQTEALKQDRTSALKEIDRFNWQLGELQDIGTVLEGYERELKETKARELEQEMELAALKLATDTIASLSDELHDNFATDFNGILSEEVSLATDGVYNSARVNADFEIEVMSGLDYVGADSLSAGTAEQIYLAFRFAAARLMLGGIQVPLLLDESFAYSDDLRLRAALSALADREGQVFVFTCTGREKSMLDALGAQYRAIKM